MLPRLPPRPFPNPHKPNPHKSPPPTPKSSRHPDVTPGSADFNAPDEALCHAFLDRAVLDGGINLVDTAEQYPIPSDRARPEGATEAIISKWLAKVASACAAWGTLWQLRLCCSPLDFLHARMRRRLGGRGGGAEVQGA